MFVPDPKLEALHITFDGGTKILSIRSFLSANAVRSTNSLDGIDDCSSNNSTDLRRAVDRACPRCSRRWARTISSATSSTNTTLAKTKDKDFIVIEGAVHGFTPCTRCETTPGQYSNSMKNLMDYIRGLDQQALLTPPGAEGPRVPGAEGRRLLM